MRAPSPAWRGRRTVRGQGNYEHRITITNTGYRDGAEAEDDDDDKISLSWQSAVLERQRQEKLERGCEDARACAASVRRACLAVRCTTCCTGQFFDAFEAHEH